MRIALCSLLLVAIRVAVSTGVPDLAGTWTCEKLREQLAEILGG